MNTSHTEDSRWDWLCALGGTAALLQLACTVVILVAIVALGPKPATAEEYYSAFRENAFTGLLRADFASVVLIAFYLGTFSGIFAALRRVDGVYAGFAALLICIGVTVCFATDSGFSLLRLSNQYAAATTGAQRTQLLAAGEAVIAADMWNSTGSYMAGMLLQGAGVLISAVMLRSTTFGRATAYFGLLANGLDLVQHLLHPFAPSVADTVMMVGGPAYLVWFPLIARDLLKLWREACAQSRCECRREVRLASLR